jgi:hypothetical protein
VEKNVEKQRFSGAERPEYLMKARFVGAGTEK